MRGVRHTLCGLGPLGTWIPPEFDAPAALA